MRSSFPSRQPRRSIRPKIEELEPRLPPASDFFIVGGAAGETVTVRFDWLKREAAFQNEIGVYRVQDEAGRVAGLLPGEAGYAQAALNAGQVLFRSGQGTGAVNLINFTAGDRLAFYLIPNDTTAAARTGAALAFFSVDGANPDGVEHVIGTAQPDGGLRLAFEDMPGGGDLDHDDAIITVGGAGLLSAPGQPGQSVLATFTYASRDADYANEVGLFRVDDAAGRVAGLLPSAPGYAQAALTSATRQVLFGPGDSPGATRAVTLESGARYALYMVSNATTDQFLQSNPGNAPGAGPVAFFSLPGANPDGVAHADWLSPGVIGFEDLLGGGDFDFNDLVLQVQFGAPTGTPATPPPPAPDTTPPVVTASLTNDTFDPARVTAPNDTSADGVTSDPVISGVVADASQIVSFRAGIDSTNTATFVNILDALRPDGTFLLNRARLDQIAGLPLIDGPHTLRLQAIDASGNVSALASVAFTLDTRATATLLLAAGSDTGVAGDFRTDNDEVTLVGTTEPFASVRLQRNTGTGYVDIGTTFADPSGQFSFATVALGLGPNAFRVLATDDAGNVGVSGATISNNAAPTVAQPIGTVTVIEDSAPSTFDLSAVFDDENNALPIFEIDTSVGTVLVQLFEGNAPLHTANFSNYANSGGFDNTFFHRLIAGFVAQGGGFEFIDGGTPNFVDTPENAPVTNEPGLPNSRGTVALAKQAGNPSSGTDEFFFNLADNVANLDFQNGGFTVFGQVVGNGGAVLDALAAVPTFDLPEFQDVPLRNNFTGTSFQDATANNVVLINSVTELTDPLTYSIVSNDNPGLVTPTITGSQLQLAYTPATNGTATVVVRATDTDGSFVDHTFTVQVNPN